MNTLLEHLTSRKTLTIRFSCVLDDRDILLDHSTLFKDELWSELDT